MKPQTTKKLFAFIVVMMFSISFLNAQCLTCKGNQVSVYKCKRCVGMEALYPCTIDHCLLTKCVPESKIQEYLVAGWQLCSSPFIAQSSNKIPVKKESKNCLVKISAGSGIVSHNIFKR